MKKIALLGMVLALSLLMVGCGSSNGPGLSTTGTDIPAESKEPSVKPAGTTAVPGSKVELQASAGTGYEWTCRIDNEAFVTSSVETAGDAETPGGSTTTTVTFNGVAEGTTYAVVKLERSFENSAAAELHVYTLTVDESLKVSVAEVTMPFAEMSVKGDGDHSVTVSDPQLLVYGGDYDEATQSYIFRVTSVLPVSGEVAISTNGADGSVISESAFTVEVDSSNNVSAKAKA